MEGGRGRREGVEGGGGEKGDRSKGRKEDKDRKIEVIGK